MREWLSLNDLLFITCICCAGVFFNGHFPIFLLHCHAACRLDLLCSRRVQIDIIFAWQDWIRQVKLSIWESYGMWLTVSWSSRISHLSNGLGLMMWHFVSPKANSKSSSHSGVPFEDKPWGQINFGTGINTHLFLNVKLLCQNMTKNTHTQNQY